MKWGDAGTAAVLGKCQVPRFYSMERAKGKYGGNCSGFVWFCCCLMTKERC